MIHIENVPHVLKFGITHKNSINANPKFINIGDISLISTRNNKEVIVNNGDLLNVDGAKIILGHFIPFYFWFKMPMLYVIQNGGNFVERATAAKEIVYLICYVEKVIKSVGDYYFSNGHATDEMSGVYDKSRINDMPDLIDWSAVKTPYWGGEENLIIKRKKQAEFLVLGDLPPDCIAGFVCYNEQAKNQLMSMGIEEKKIEIRPEGYF